MSGVEDIVTIEHESLGEQVYKSLRGMLIAGQFQPGEKVTLRSLAKALGTSPMPVRDALRQLMVDHAIELLPNRTFRVPVMTKSRFIELREIRLRLEGMAVEEATGKIDAPTLQQIREVSAWFNKECDAAEPDRMGLIRANKTFHFLVYQASRMPVLVQIIEGLWSQIGPILNLDIRKGSERIANKVPCEHHEALIAAMAARDSRAACRALETDIKAAGEHILRSGGLPDA